MTTRLAVLGDRDPSKVTHRELDAALSALHADVQARWVDTDSDAARNLDEFDAVWLAPGNPYADDSAVYAAIRWARESKQPFLATCSGFQYAVIEFARNVAGYSDAAHAEESPDAESLVVQPLTCSLVGKQREVHPVPGTRLADICGPEPFLGSHWCNYGFADPFIAPLVAAGLTVSATAADAGVEAIEYHSHPFFIGTLFQPQMGSSHSGVLHPLITALLTAAK